MQNTIERVRVLLVDDEPLAREGLSIVLSELPEIDIVGEASTGAEALQLIGNLNPDLVFLDIEMPDMSGFDVIERLEKRESKIVFVTAYDHYAIKAFEVHAVDYLLKPVDRELAKRAVSRIVHSMQMVQTVQNLHSFKSIIDTIEQNREAPKQPQRFSIKVDGHILFLEKEAIPLIEANGDYVTVYYRDKKYMVHEKLKKLESKLEKDGFVRVHRSYLVNKASIFSIRNLSFGEFEITLKRFPLKIRSGRTFHQTMLSITQEVQ
jgi:two-component system LytT family response regulator